MKTVKNYDNYQMQVQHFDSLLLRFMDQLESITNENDRTHMFQTMSALKYLSLQDNLKI